MKKYNCPDCQRTDSCNNCQRASVSTLTRYPTNFGIEYYKNTSSLNSVPLVCMNCNNHPSNGGTGICYCTLGSIAIY